MRKNQKGFTIVELIIAVAILSVVTLAVCGFIVVGSRSYTSANTDIMLQQDAQLALNQMSDVIIDTTESISYSGLVGGSMQTVLKDSEFSGEPTDKSLTVVNKKPEPGDTNQNLSYIFYYNKDKGTIYFNEVDLYEDTATPTAEEIKDKFDAAISDPDNTPVLAEHVTEFSVDVSQFEENRVVMLSLIFENGNRVYSTSNNVTVRNRIAINDITVGPMKRAEDFAINAPDSITVEPGESYTFTGLKINGEDAQPGDIKWSLLGEAKNGSNITESGTVTVGLEETRKNFKVVATRAAFDDSRSTKEVTVQVKRVTDVSLTCSAASVKAGDTVTINATAIGNYLGVKCDACNLPTDNDYDVYDWTVTKATPGTETARNLQITIDSGLKEGDEVVIEASSLLSNQKHYGPLNNPTVPPVKGRLVLKLSKGNEGEFPIKGDLKFGTDNDPGILDYMRSRLKTDWGRYVYCVRVREMDATNAADDRIVIYYTMGANERFYPDIFGLDLTRSYKVYFQVLDPVSVETRKAKERGEGVYFEDDPEDIVAEYLKNCDPITGEYIGTKYEADYLYSGMLNKPTITVEYNGVTYPNGLANYFEYVALPTVGAGSGIINKINLGDVINIDKDNNSNGILNKVEFSIYKDGEPLNVFDEKTMSYVGVKDYANGMIHVEDRGSSMLLKKNSGGTPPEEAYGTYTVVPGFRYANSLAIREYEYIYPLKNGSLDTSAFYREGRGGGDYTEHYYPQEQCTVTVKVDKGLNLQLPSENGEELWTYFPVPSAMSFPFTRNISSVQTKTWSRFTVYTRSLEWRKDLDNIKVDCQYVSDEGYYKIWLYTESGRDSGSYKRNVIGIYGCRPGEDTWTPLNLYPNDDSVDYKTNIEYTKDNSTWAAYFPYPTDADFPFKDITKETETTYTFIAYNKNSNYDTQFETVKVVCKPENGTYTITLRSEKVNEWNDQQLIVTTYGVWTYSDGKWVQKEGSSTSYERIWDTLGYFTYSGTEYMVEIPLPGSENFPSFTESYTDSNVSVYKQDDKAGNNIVFGWGQMELVYTKEGGTYKATLKRGYGSSEIVAVWTYDSDGNSWILTQP